jgi:hypothetical protein
MWPCKNTFRNPCLVSYCFATPPIKLKEGQQIRRGLLRANHLDQSLWWANWRHWASVISYLLHSFLLVHIAVVHFTSHYKRCYTEPKLFSRTKPANFGVSSSNFPVQCHILITLGNALSVLWSLLSSGSIMNINTTSSIK